MFFGEQLFLFLVTAKRFEIVFFGQFQNTLHCDVCQTAIELLNWPGIAMVHQWYILKILSGIA